MSATGQRLSLASVTGGTRVAVPTVTTVAGTQLAATVPSEATVSAGAVSFSRAGSYQWPFSADGFSGSFVLKVTSDVPDENAHAGASSCVQAGKVWVVVERDTGRQQGGCASEFGTGLEALTSAGFHPDRDWLRHGHRRLPEPGRGRQLLVVLACHRPDLEGR